MNLPELDLSSPIFAQREVLSLSRADTHTIDNWVRYGHVAPARVGGRRLFSAENLIMIELLVMMRDPFNILPEVGREIAKAALDEYRRTFAQRDLDEIAQGAAWAALVGERGDSTWGLARGEDGNLRAVERGDPAEHQVMVVLPVRLVARSVLAKIKLWLEQEND